jgi:hypothetical protein
LVFFCLHKKSHSPLYTNKKEAAERKQRKAERRKQGLCGEKAEKQRLFSASVKKAAAKAIEGTACSFLPASAGRWHRSGEAEVPEPKRN